MQLRFMLQGRKKIMGRHDFQFFIVYFTVLSHYILNVLYTCIYIRRMSEKLDKLVMVRVLIVTKS